MTIATTYLYTDRDGTGTQDPAMRAYGCRFIGQTCERAALTPWHKRGPWRNGKALMRFSDGTLVIVRSRLLRKLPA